MGRERSEKESVHSLVLRHSVRCGYGGREGEGEAKAGVGRVRRRERGSKVGRTSNSATRTDSVDFNFPRSRRISLTRQTEKSREQWYYNGAVYRSFFRSDAPFPFFSFSSSSSSSSSPSSSSSLRVSSAGFPRTIPYSTRRTASKKRDQTRSTARKREKERTHS
jgi:hypothetical protein